MANNALDNHTVAEQIASVITDPEHNPEGFQEIAADIYMALEFLHLEVSVDDRWMHILKQEGEVVQ